MRQFKEPRHGGGRCREGAEIMEDMGAAVGFNRDMLGLMVRHEAGTSYAEVEIAGVLHFGNWLRSVAEETMPLTPMAAGRVGGG